MIFFYLFPEGVCEIWLTSEDTGAYGRDIGTDLPTLLWRLVEEIPEGAMLRLGMTNPPYILEHLEVRTVHGHQFHPELPSKIMIHH